MGTMSGNDQKVAKAKIFCNNRLTYLRSEGMFYNVVS